MDQSSHIIPNVFTEIPKVPPDTIISKTIHNDDKIKVVLFGIAPEQELSEHTVGFPAIIHVLSGETKITLGEKSIDADPGTWVHMPADTPHSLSGKTTTIMILTLVKT